MQRIRTSEDIREGLSALAGRDVRLREAAARCGEVPLRLAPPGFAGLASIIVSQQVSKASASAIFGRLEALVDPLDAESLLVAGEAVFREAGLSRPKQRALVNAAEAVAARRLDLDRVCDRDIDTAMGELTQVKGIGPWTAEIYLMFCAGHRDVFPAGDLALQEAARVLCGLDARPDPAALREIAANWSPWRSVAARLLWAYYQTIKGGRDAVPV